MSVGIDPISRFSDRVENYVKFRPGYPREAIRFIIDEFSLSGESQAVDIGGGTGISTRALLREGIPTIAIEPNTQMREAAAEFLKNYDGVSILNGSAESTLLDSESVDLVASFQAFHWFANKNAVTEFKRIARHGCGIALVWNERQLDSNAFLREYERLLIDYGRDYQNVRHDQISEDSLSEEFGISFSTKSFPNSQTLDFEGLLGRLSSSSYMPNFGEFNFEEMNGKLFALFSRFEKDGRVSLLYNTNIYYGIL